MSHNDIIRAWKDEEYRNSLSEEQRAKLPKNPAGEWEELDEQMMEALAGGAKEKDQWAASQLAYFTVNCDTMILAAISFNSKSC